MTDKQLRIRRIIYWVIYFITAACMAVMSFGAFIAVLSKRPSLSIQITVSAMLVLSMLCPVVAASLASLDTKIKTLEILNNGRKDG